MENEMKDVNCTFRNEGGLCMNRDCVECGLVCQSWMRKNVWLAVLV